MVERAFDKGVRYQRLILSNRPKVDRNSDSLILCMEILEPIYSP